MNSITLSRPGVMLEVLGQGVLLQGESGSGKSDLALGLVDRGHRLVADDLVEFVVEAGMLCGRAVTGAAGFIEISGLGIVNLAELYGVRAVCPQAPLTLVLWLDAGAACGDERLSPAERPWQLAGISVPAWCLPYAQLRDLPLLVETAVRLNLSRRRGYDACSDLHTRLHGRQEKGAA